MINQKLKRPVRLNATVSVFTSLFLLLINLLPWHAYGNSADFYLTVERSFGTHENAEVRIDFANKHEPLTLRFLRPENVDTFLAGQLNLSRSYEEPRAVLNPGHYILKGINKIQAPAESFRRLLSADFRRTFGENLKSPIRKNGYHANVSVPPRFTIAPPKGFKIEREMYIDLQTITTASDFNVPGYEDSEWWERSYLQKTIAIENLPAGLYLMQAVQGQNEAQALLQISELSAQITASSREILLRLVDRKLQPVEGASLEVRNEQGQWKRMEGVTDEHGELLVSSGDKDFDSRQVMRVVEGKRSAYIDTEFLSVTSKPSSVFLMTDRPIFKPGEEFSFKGIIRNTEGPRASLPFSEGSALKPGAKLLSSFVKNIEIGDVQSKLTSFATFSGKFDIPESAEPGLYEVNTEVGDSSFKGELRIKDYIKPTFYLKIENENGIVRPGEEFSFSVKAQKYAGGFASGARAEVYVYRKKYEAPQWVDEAGGGLSTGFGYSGESAQASTYNQPVKLYSTVDERMRMEREERSNSDDDVMSARYGKKDPDFSGSWATAQSFDANGTANFSFKLPAEDWNKKKESGASQSSEEWIYTISVKAMDKQGAQAAASKNYYATLSPVVASLRFTKPIINSQSEDGEVIVQTQLAEGGAAALTKGELVLELEDSKGNVSLFKKIPFSTDAAGTVRLKIPKPEKGGRLIGYVTLARYGEIKLSSDYRSSESSMIVATEDGQAVVNNAVLELYPEKVVLEPDEKARIFVLLPKNWGAGEKGEIWESFAGRKIFSKRSREFSGRTLWIETQAKREYGSGYYHTVTIPLGNGKFIEKTLNFKIIESEKILDIDIAPLSATAQPLQPLDISFQVKDSAGSPAADTELAVSVVDRAVYAVQGEIRPNIFDFFYPVPRLNVMSFYSDELQGYGYSDKLTRPNFSLEAIKSSQKQYKKNFRDTAGFFPHVVTDSAGKATIRVSMPANITEWLITAVAVDKSGRFGEATAKIRTTVDVTFTPAIAQFLRENDELEGSVALQNLSAKPVKVAFDVQGKDGVNAKLISEVNLKGQESKTFPFTMSTSGQKGVAAIHLNGSARGVSVGGTGEYSSNIYPAGMKETIFATVPDGGRPARLAALGGIGEKEIKELVADIPNGSAIFEVRVDGIFGLLGAALQGARYLVTYPYGCTEQLTHSTVPNLALLKLIDDAGLSAEDLGAAAETLVKARANVSLGLSKILKNQTAPGGFGMWADSAPDVFMTLIALDGLKIAARHGEYSGVEQAISRAERWLENENAVQKVIAGAGSDFEKAFAISKVMSSSVWGWSNRESLAGFIKEVAASDRSSIFTLTTALKILTTWQGDNRGTILKEYQLEPVVPVIYAKLAAALKGFDSGQYTEALRARLVSTEDDSSLGFSGRSSQLIAAAMGELRRSPLFRKEDLSAAKVQLLNEFRNGMWDSTFDTAQVILNASTVIADEATTIRAMVAQSSLPVLKTGQGKKIGTLSATVGGFSGTFTGSKLTAADVRNLKIENAPSDIIASASFKVFVGDKEIVERDSGVLLERSFVVLSNGTTRETKTLDDLKVGDVVVSRVKVLRTGNVPQSSVPSRFLVIEDPVPSVGEAIEADETYLAEAGLLKGNENVFQKNARSTLRYPEKTIRVLEASAAIRTEHELANVWRVRYRGKASLPAAQASDMYDEGVRGNTLSIPVVVR